MTITISDLVWRASALTSDTAIAENGGSCNFNSTILNGIKNNLMPDVSQTDRLVGVTTVRKAFLAINKNEAVELLNAQISLGAPTPATDFVVIAQGTPTDTQVDLPTKWYGVGTVSTAYTASATDIVIAPENFAWYQTNAVFAIGDVIKVSNGTNTELSVVSNVVYNTTTITLTIDPVLTNSYGVGSKVAGVIMTASVKASYTDPVVTSTTGVFNASGNLIVWTKGTPDVTYTLTFTSPTVYTVSSSTAGNLGSFTTGSDAVCNLPSTTIQAFSIKSTGFSGTFAIGDTIVFSCSSATLPIWVQRIVPPNTSNLANDYLTLTVSGESY